MDNNNTPNNQFIINLNFSGAINQANQDSEESSSDVEKIIQQSDIEGTTPVYNNQALDEVIFNALEKVKTYFFNSKMDERKLIDFMYNMLTMNGSNHGDTTYVPNLLDEMINELLLNDESDTKSDSNEDIIDKLLGKDTAKAIHEKLVTEKVDQIVENLLGEEAKKLLCEKLDIDNLDDLLNKLVDEKLSLEDNPEGQHPNFDDFIDKILGKDTEEFIKKSLEALSHDKNNLPDESETEKAG